MVHQVGSNGGGKSSTVSLLSRLFDPTTGEILIDGKPLKDYVISDIREAQAILRQDYQHFPFSIAENIAIGRPGSDEPDAVRQAAQLADAQDLIEERGYEANVKPMKTLEAGWELRGSELELDSKRIEKPIELSGGEWQRLALARLFMRAASERVRLIVADEPSASLDPKVEYGAWLNPLKCLHTDLGMTQKSSIDCGLWVAKGRKRAYSSLIALDTSRILPILFCRCTCPYTRPCGIDLYTRCLKGGRLVESGSHQELMERKGEYYELYNVQAQAYA